MAASTLTLTPVEDTFVSATNPTDVNGSDPTGKVDDVGKIAYFKFNVAGIPAGSAVLGAILAVVGVGVQSSAVLEAHAVSNSWSEASTNYSNRPALGALLDTATVAAGKTASFDVPVSGNGTVSFAVSRSASGPDNIIGLRENPTVGNRPKLVVSYGAPPAAPPTVSAGPDAAVTTPDPATLNGSVSVGVVSAGWSKVSGPGAVTFADPAAVDTTATFSEAGAYVLQLWASDGSLSATDTVGVTVSPPPAPPPPPPPSSGAGILLSPAELGSLPTSGAGWSAIMNRVNSPPAGQYAIGVRDESDVTVLAYALAGARLGNDTYKGFVRDKIGHVVATGRNDGDVLATLRNLAAYVISADLIDLKTFDAGADNSFRGWLRTEVSHVYAGGGGGGSVLSIADYKANNFGTHANAARLAVGLYLGDTVMYRKGRDVWYGWATGDRAYVPDPRNWTGTNWQCDPAAGGARYGINPAGCTRDGHSFDGIIPEDMTRQGEYTGAWPPPGGAGDNYIHGAADGMTLAFWIIARQGEDPWAWGDRAGLRQMQWKYNQGQPPYSGFLWQLPVIEDAYGVDFGGNDPAATSTNCAWADWWAHA